jgi:hypothetical protein
LEVDDPGCIGAGYPLVEWGKFVYRSSQFDGNFDKAVSFLAFFPSLKKLRLV